MKDKFSEERLMELLSDLNPKLDNSEKNLIIDCPSCGERECSISVDKDKNDKGHLWGCFRLKNCGERGNIWKILKLLGKLENIIYSKSENVDFIDIKSLSLLNEIPDDELTDDLSELPTVLKPFGWTKINNNFKYLDDRGFKSYQHCDVGYTLMEPKLKDYIIFLINEDKKIKGHVGRHTWSKDEINNYNDNYFIKTGFKNKIKRYKNSEGTDFSKLLYGYDEITEVKPVCLVEGIFDKHAVDEKLMLKENQFMYTCATFKCFISDSQIIKLKIKGVTDIILFYDSDVINQIKKNIIKLTKFFNVKVILSKLNKDPDEMTQMELIETFEMCMHDSNNFIENFIQVKMIK